jgi:hypothetical protein
MLDTTAYIADANDGRMCDLKKWGESNGPGESAAVAAIGCGGDRNQ